MRNQKYPGYTSATWATKSNWGFFLLKNTPVCKMSVKIHNKMEAKSFKMNKKAKKYF